MSSTVDLSAWVYKNARDGKVQPLKNKLSSLPQQKLKELVNSTVSGSTSLVIACRNGHLDVVDFLVHVSGADIETPGSVLFDGESIEGAPPLWCSAAAGHMDIVKYLLEHGANVNNTTFTNSTPLRAACFDGHYEIVKYLVENNANVEVANRHGHTCLMIACYKGHYDIVNYLIEKGADIARSSLKGNTALHDCAESGSLKIMKLLMKHNAPMVKDAYGMTPLLAAAVTGHTHVVEYLLACDNINKEEKVHAMELLGATYIDKKRDIIGALKYWRKALIERLIPPEVIEKPKNTAVVEAYENAKEFRTQAELTAIANDPDEMRMQALVVRERILGPTHPDTSYYIRYRGAVYADLGDFARCIKLWIYALKMQLNNLEPLNLMTQSSFLSFAELFYFMGNIQRLQASAEIKAGDLGFVLQSCILEVGYAMKNVDLTGLKTQKDRQNYNRLMIIAMHLVSVVTQKLPALSKDEQFHFKTLVYRLDKLKPRTTLGLTPLHLACSKDTSSIGRYPVCNFPSMRVVNLLLELNADVNAVDNEGNTPLHTAACNKPVVRDVLSELLQHGAHIDTINNMGKRPEDLLTDIIIGDIVKPVQYVNLRCLAARAIRMYNLPYENEVPVDMVRFISKH